MTILLSTYNGAQYLEAFLHSLLGQTYQQWQLLVRDDGSTDCTLDILRYFAANHADKVLDIICDGSNLGSMRSFEVLMQQAAEHDSHFMFADQDDIWLPDKIAQAMQALQQAEAQQPQSPLLVCTDLIVVDKNLKQISPSFQKYTAIKPHVLGQDSLIACTNYVTGCTTAFNLRALKAALPFGRHAMHHDHWLALKVKANKGQIIYLNKAQILYRQHTNNQCGATATPTAMGYLPDRLKRRSAINNINNRLYLQANEALNMSRLGFWARKIYYIIRRQV